MLPWVEKHRPHAWSDMVGNTSVAEYFGRCAREKKPLHHVLLVGPPGIGKTSALKCFARQRLGSSFAKAFREVNASDDRSASAIRAAVRGFLSQRLSLRAGQRKILLCDEMEAMTPDAQQTLCDLIDAHQARMCFALACNSIDSVSARLLGRLTVLRFQRLADEDVGRRLRVVLEREGCTEVCPAGFQHIVQSSRGDLRSAINNAQAVVSVSSRLSLEAVTAVVSVPPQNYLVRFLRLCQEAKMKDARSVLLDLLRQGYSCLDATDALIW